MLKVRLCAFSTLQRTRHISRSEAALLLIVPLEVKCCVCSSSKLQPVKAVGSYGLNSLLVRAERGSRHTHALDSHERNT